MERSQVLLKKNERFSRSFPFFAKERCILCILFRSLQKIVRSLRSFGSHNSPKTREKTEKNGMFFFKNGKERNVPNEKERGAQPWSAKSAKIAKLSTSPNSLH